MPNYRHKKARYWPGYFCATRKQQLLDLCFLVHDVLSYDWIELLHLQFGCHGALVLGRGVEMSGARGGHEFDLVSHDVLSVKG